MDNLILKSLDAAFKQVSSGVKKCRSGHQALVQLAAFNGTGDAMALTIAELEAASEQLIKDARAFAKQVQDLSTSVIGTTQTTEDN